MRLQPSNPRTWLALGRFDLAPNPAAAVQEMRAGIYLDPASISPEALTTGHPEAVETYNDYVQALRALAQREAALRTATRTARASKSRRAPRGPAARRTESCSKPNEAMSAAERRAAVVAQVIAERIEARARTTRRRERGGKQL